MAQKGRTTDNDRVCFSVEHLASMLLYAFDIIGLADYLSFPNFFITCDACELLFIFPDFFHYFDYKVKLVQV